MIHRLPLPPAAITLPRQYGSLADALSTSACMRMHPSAEIFLWVKASDYSSEWLGLHDRLVCILHHPQPGPLIEMLGKLLSGAKCVLLVGVCPLRFGEKTWTATINRRQE